MKNNKVVYAYFDGEECFYIGIGEPKRSHSLRRSARNNFTLRKVYKAKTKNSLHIEILHSGLSWEMACWYERMYIRAIGRRDLGLGTLTNLTDGGEGSPGAIRSSKQKQDLSNRWKTDLNPMKWMDIKDKPSTISVVTPLGVFDSVGLAAKAHGSYQQQMGYWCRSQYKTEFYYQDKKLRDKYKRLPYVKSKKVSCEGIVFDSIGEAANYYKVTRSAITYRMKKDSYPDFYYI